MEKKSIFTIEIKDKATGEVLLKEESNLCYGICNKGDYVKGGFYCGGAHTATIAQFLYQIGKSASDQCRHIKDEFGAEFCKTELLRGVIEGNADGKSKTNAMPTDSTLS